MGYGTKDWIQWKFQEDSLQKEGDQNLEKLKN